MVVAWIMDESERAAVLGISRAELDEVARHAAESYPEECCGFLVGICDVGGVRVLAVWRAENESSGDRRLRFSIAPERVLAALRRARARGFELVGYYHSHPDHPAEPSPTDRESAWPGMSYLIVPVVAGVAGAARSWRLLADRSGFLEETLRATGDGCETAEPPRRRAGAAP